MYDLRQVTIYTAGDSAQASLLVNRLERHGIRAMVLNETLQSGAAEIIGQAVALKIVVVASEADAARAIAETFDRELVESAHYENTEERTWSAETIAAWPVCDGCQRPRHTMCEICGTAGSDFPLADMPPAQAMTDEALSGEAGPVLMVLCPTCDEPFVPEFLRRCQWCDHDFGEGRDYDLAPDGDMAPDGSVTSQLLENLNHRALGLAVGVLAVLVALAVYFATVAGGY